MAIFGYARVNMDEQTVDAQVAALKAAGAVRVFREAASLATFPFYFDRYPNWGKRSTGLSVY
jgi:hypothetical protein